MTNYVFCLMQVRKSIARHSVFAHGQARVSLLLTNGRNANGRKSNRIALTHLPPASQSELAHLEKCPRYQLAIS